MLLRICSYVSGCARGTGCLVLAVRVMSTSCFVRAVWKGALPGGKAPSSRSLYAGSLLVIFATVLGGLEGIFGFDVRARVYYRVQGTGLGSNVDRKYV